MTVDEILLSLAIKYNGDWELIYKAILEKESSDLEQYLEIGRNMKCNYITIMSSEYPQEMRCQYHPPFVLFYYGDISLLKNVKKNVGVIGSRKCSEYGAKMTEKIVSEIASDYVIVSGLALGIDKIAHETAIANGGRTIAVLGNGIDFIYLSGHMELYEYIKRNDLVISEYPHSTLPTLSSFPSRNRIIAMISAGLLVTEAYARSGSLTTVMFALQCQRLVLCVPYPADAQSECNRLISDGAYLVENGKQVKEILNNEIHL